MSAWLQTHPYRRVLVARPVRWFTVGFLVSSVGDGIALVAVPWLALDVAGHRSRGIAVALATLASLVPGIPVGLLLRHRRLPSRPVLLLDSVWRAGLFGLIAALAASGSMTLPLLVALLAGTALLRTLAVSARRLLLASLVDREHLLAANSLYGVAFMLGTTVIGGALAGLLVSHRGVATALLVDAGSFLLFGLAVAAVRPGEHGAEHAAPRGPATARLTGVVAWLIGVAFAIGVLDGITHVALPIFVRYSVHGGAALYGDVFAVFGLGALAGGLVFGGFRRRASVDLITLAAVVGWGSSTIVLALFTHRHAILVAAAAGGLFFGPFTAACLTAIQRATPPAALQRAMAIWAAVQTGALPLGVVAAGPLVAWIGPRGALLATGIVTCAVGVLWVFSRSLSPKASTW